MSGERDVDDEMDEGRPKKAYLVDPPSPFAPFADIIDFHRQVEQDADLAAYLAWIQCDFRRTLRWRLRHPRPGDDTSLLLDILTPTDRPAS